MQVRELGQTDYGKCWQTMRDFTDQRAPDSPDEIWLTEHPPVFTLGQAGREQHVLDAGDIPLIRTDRGGQVTYHGPGQLVAYLLIDLRRRAYGVREMVHRMEQALIDLLQENGLDAQRRAHAPGVYFRDAKIAALGLRIRHGCSYHGLSLNVDMDLAPFERIHPCGYTNLRVTQLRDWVIDVTMSDVSNRLTRQLVRQFKQDSRG